MKELLGDWYEIVPIKGKFKPYLTVLAAESGRINNKANIRPVTEC